MKKFLYSSLTVIAALVLVFVLGPRPDDYDKVTFDPSVLQHDLDTYLAQSEAGIPELKPGAAKEIVWAHPSTKQKTPLSIVYLHGFSATKHETRPVPDNVAGAVGANLYFARFKGHGRDGEGLAEATVQDWANDFAEAMEIGKLIGNKTIIMAASNGGMISTWGLAKPELTGNVAGVVFVSPNFELQGISTWLANIPWAEKILPAVAGEHREWEPSNELHRKWWTYSYPSRAIFPMTAMLKLVKDIDVSKITVPALMFYSPDDKVIVPAEIEKAIDAWGGPVKTVKVENPSDGSSHVIMGDALGPEYTETATGIIIDWINSLSP